MKAQEAMERTAAIDAAWNDDKIKTMQEKNEQMAQLAALVDQTLIDELLAILEETSDEKVALRILNTASDLNIKTGLVQKAMNRHEKLSDAVWCAANGIDRSKEAVDSSLDAGYSANNW